MLTKKRKEKLFIRAALTFFLNLFESPEGKCIHDTFNAAHIFLVQFSSVLSPALGPHLTLTYPPALEINTLLYPTPPRQKLYRVGDSFGINLTFLPIFEYGNTWTKYLVLHGSV